MTLPTHTVAGRPFPRMLGALALLLVMLNAFSGRADAQSQEEARAIFLYNFAKFVEWPASAFADAATPVTITIVGDANVARALERYVKGKNANGRDLVVKKLDAAEGCADSHIVFVGEARFAAAVIAQINGRPVLSVGDDESFLKSGGAIRLFAKDGKVLCAINTKVAEAVGLKLGEKLVKASS